jgi:antitoxin (DNA-binding transcriptional repressor) of toxin-antitoxin stability system
MIEVGTVAYEGSMNRTLPLDAASPAVRELVEGLAPGEQVVITSKGEPMAVLTRASSGQWPCAPGSAKGTEHWMAPDFDAPLDDFKEYME